VRLTLELKLIAQVGLVGLPNAGKSTLISTLTSARPKIAQYPFTTLEASLGVLVASLQKEKKPLVIADIPGLIEGASEGKGLGDLFLRHIERTKVIVHLIDVSKVKDGPNGPEVLWRDYQTIKKELKSYSRELAKKSEILVFSKADLVTKADVERAMQALKKHRRQPVVISALTGEGLGAFLSKLYKKVKESEA